MKRRSTRIVQAVPLTVTGVDALGRPFEERTSTSILNCHGCRYQSKHYVLKNMWVTLEVPHPEQGQPPRNVRARVMWIQRPRTVRELFQVGVELEVPGNLWGIAFCPPDWFPFPENVPELPAPAIEAPREEVAPSPVDTWSDLQEHAPVEGNVRTIPIAAPVASTPESALAISREMARLVSDANEQLRNTVREQAVEAVSAEVQPLLASVENQLRETAQRTVETAAAPAAEEAVRIAVANAEAAAEARLSKLVDELAAKLEQHRPEAPAPPAEAPPELSEAVKQQLQDRVNQGLTQLSAAASDSQATVEQARETLEMLRRQAEESIAAALERGMRLQAQAEEARTRASEIENSLRQLIEQASSVSASAQTAWKARLEADVADATSHWNSQVNASLESTTQQAAERLVNAAQIAGQQFEKDLAGHIEGMNKTFLEAATEAENRLGAVRASYENQAGNVQSLLNQVQAAAQSVSQQTAQLASLQETVQRELERRAAALVDLQSEELARRGESAMAAWASRLQPSLEAAGQETITRLGAQLEQQLGAQLDRASQVLGRLESESLAAADAQRKREETLEAASRRAIEEAATKLQRQIDQLVGQDFQEAGRKAVNQWLAELDAKANETTHTTFESLYKTSEWYEKKVQTQMQSTLEKGVEQGVEQLRNKAGEISRLFAGELDHYSRSYVEHTEGQIEETGRETVERARNQVKELGAQALSSLALQMQAGTDAAIGDFNSKMGSALGKLAAQMEQQVAQSRARIESITQRLTADFSASLQQQAQQAVANAKVEMTVLADSLHDRLLAESERREQYLHAAIVSATDAGIEAYKQRLENAANSWLLTTASRLNEHSLQQLETLARTAEARLSETCKQVFANVGKALQQQMADLPVPPATKPPGGDAA